MLKRLFEQLTDDEAKQGQVWGGSFGQSVGGMEEAEQTEEGLQVGEGEKGRRMMMVRERRTRRDSVLTDLKWDMTV